MNHKFKLKVVALMATLSGSALGSCQAMQVDANSADPVAMGVVRPAEPAFDGAFGAVTSAKPIPQYGESELPPIVSPGYATATEQQSLPPIVTPDRPAQPTMMLNSVSEYKPKKKAGMLSPLAPIETEVPQMQYETAEAPVIQASNATGQPQDGSSVQQAQWGQAGYSRGVSSAGVPIYSQAQPAGYSPRQELPPILQGDMVAPSVNVPSVVQGQMPSAPYIGSGSQAVTPMNTMVPAAPIEMQSPPMMNSAPMMNYAPPAQMGQTYFNSTPMEAPVISGGCSSCAGNGCSDCGIASSGADISGCNSCGSGGCFNDDQVASKFGCCGSVYSARRYLMVDALYFNRDDGLIANSNFGALNSFDANLGWRFTIGTRSDATRGQEASYFGTSEMDQTATRTNAAGLINARFTGTDGFTGAETSAFRNAVEQVESKSTEIHSLEFNKVRWGWDVVKSFVGLRYIYVEDNYQMASRNLTGDVGTFQMNTHNNLFGPHIGGEVFYDVGYRLSWSLASKFGAYANFNKVDTRLNNAGAQFLDVEDDNATLSGSIELSLFGHYQLSQQARFRFGYNALWLGEVASVSDNMRSVLTPTTGADTSDSDDMFFHGVSLGLEIFR